MPLSICHTLLKQCKYQTMLNTSTTLVHLTKNFDQFHWWEVENLSTILNTFVKTKPNQVMWNSINVSITESFIKHFMIIQNYSVANSMDYCSTAFHIQHYLFVWRYFNSFDILLKVIKNAYLNSVISLASAVSLNHFPLHLTT